MCTAMSITSQNDDIIFGRTMDFSHELDPSIYIIPKHYKWLTYFNKQITNKYKVIGTGQDIGKIIMVDGVNENGLSCAALFFKDFAYLPKESKLNKEKISAIELVNYLLGNYSNIDEIIENIDNIDIIGVEDPITQSVAPLHWIVVDKLGSCITIEKTKKGLEIFDNPLKVLANSPNFEWHMTNLINYLNLSPNQIESQKWNNVNLIPFSQGFGTVGLPGDFTSPSRFVKIAFLKSFVELPKNNAETINTCFNIMKSVTIPKGIVITNQMSNDYTQYTVFYNINTGDYYFNSYNNNQILTTNINDIDDNNIILLTKLKKITHFDKV